jgi:putative hydrolase of the HAD superfamily
VFHTAAPLAVGARQALEQLERHYALYLLTQGDAGVQQKRVADSGLSQFFGGIFITPKKSAAVLRAVVRDLGIEPISAVVIGNSVVSDINPALEAGLSAVWIDAHVWEHERRSQVARGERVAVASSLTDLPGTLDHLAVA